MKITRLTILLLAALVSACSSPPAIDYPDGQHRIPINAARADQPNHEDSRQNGKQCDANDTTCK